MSSIPRSTWRFAALSSTTNTRRPAMRAWPIGAAERLPGGLGIMADDVIAGLLAGIIVSVLVQLRLVS